MANEAKQKCYFVSAGELSGDLIAADLVRAMRKSKPSWSCFGMGGAFSSRAGLEVVQDMFVMGKAHQNRGWSNTQGVKAATSILLSEIRARSPKFAVLIDLPQYHLELAEQIRKIGIPVFQYVAPRHWFHGKDVLAPLSQNFRKVYGTFPFEEKYYSQLGVRFKYVGSPSIERVMRISLSKINLGLRADWPHLGLFSGSRPSEVRFGLPRLLRLAERITAKLEGKLSVSMSIADGFAREDFIKASHGALSLSDESDRLSIYNLFGDKGKIFLFSGSGGELMKACDAAVVTLGTSTLECAALGTPFCAHGEGLLGSSADSQTKFYFGIKRLMRYFSKTRQLDSSAFQFGQFQSIVNLVIGREVVKEFVSSYEMADLEDEVDRLLFNVEYRDAMKKDFEYIRQIFQPGVSERVAEDIIQEISTSKS